MSIFQISQPRTPLTFKGKIKSPEEVEKVRGYITTHFGREEAQRANADMMWLQKVTDNTKLFLLNAIKDFISFERTLRHKKLPREGLWFYKIKRYQTPAAAQEAVGRLR